MNQGLHRMYCGGLPEARGQTAVLRDILRSTESQEWDWRKKKTL